MIPPQQFPVNWAQVGVFVAITFGIVGVIGWFVAHRLTLRRERLQKREKLRGIISDFEFTLTKWADIIADKNEKLPFGWGLTLRGPIDNRAIALDEVRTASIEELVTGIMVMRPQLSGNSRVRLDKEWQNYKEFKIEGIEMKDPATGRDFTSHVGCKNGLIGCLEQMKKLASEVEI